MSAWLSRLINVMICCVTANGEWRSAFNLTEINGGLIAGIVGVNSLNSSDGRGPNQLAKQKKQL